MNKECKPSGKIMIVDDTRVNLTILSGILRGEGYMVKPALSGKVALRALKLEMPDLILLDILMPEMDGYEVCRQIKADEATKDIPIIFISSLVDTTDKLEAFKVGGVDYITKPFHAEEVLARVGVHIKLQHTLKELERQSQVDGLTQISNRRYFDEFLQREFKRSRRDNIPLSIILGDVDHFKQFNDRYGHLEGDRFLQKVASALKATLKRPADLVARYGGEEFVVILPNTSLDGAMIMAEKMRTEVERLCIHHEGNPANSYATMSLGVSTNTLEIESSEELINKADIALYEAKEAGRNTVRVYKNCYNGGRNPNSLQLTDVTNQEKSIGEQS